MPKPRFFDIFQRAEDEEHSKPVEKPKIIADHREKNSLVIAELCSLGIEVELKVLPVADFLVNNTAIERKTVSDFLNSMINKRLVRQLEEMQQYPSRLLLIEGIEEQELYSQKNDGGINPNAIRGFLLSILLKSNTPILFTKNYQDTASFLAVLARKKEKSELNLRAKKKSLNKKEQLQYILEGFPGIGPAAAKKLLKEFKTIKNIVNANQEELKKLIGKKAEIFRLTEQDY
jgi:Fanconi anemia group M protein